MVLEAESFLKIAYLNKGHRRATESLGNGHPAMHAVRRLGKSWERWGNKRGSDQHIGHLLHMNRRLRLRPYGSPYALSPEMGPPTRLNQYAVPHLRLL